MFHYSEVKELNLKSFNTSKIDNILEMLDGCKTEVIDLSSFDTSSVQFAGWMF